MRRWNARHASIPSVAKRSASWRERSRRWCTSQNQVARAERAASVLFGGSFSEAAVEDILTVFDDVPSISVPAALLESGISAAELAVTAGLAASKGEAGRLIRQGGLYVNDRRLNEERGQVTMADAIGRAVIVLRKGQRERRIVRVQQ